MRRLTAGGLPVMVLLAATAASADWAIGSDHKQLKGKAIVAVGTVTEKSQRNYRTGESVEWFEFRGASEKFCFVESSLAYQLPSLPGLGADAAFVVVDDSRNLSLALIKSRVSSIEIDVRPVSVVDCPRR